MKKYNLKRFLASLLAVLMLASVTGVSPAVFAEGSATPELKASSGEVIIRSGMDDALVTETLNKALISNYDQLDDTTKQPAKPKVVKKPANPRHDYEKKLDYDLHASDTYFSCRISDINSCNQLQLLL